MDAILLLTVAWFVFMVICLFMPALFGSLCARYSRRFHTDEGAFPTA